MNYDVITRIKRCIQFKETLLARDVQSRRVILFTCMTLMEKSSDDLRGPVIEWLRTGLQLNDRGYRVIHNADDFWGELCHIQSTSKEFLTIITKFLEK